VRGAGSARAAAALRRGFVTVGAAKGWASRRRLIFAPTRSTAGLGVLAAALAVACWGACFAQLPTRPPGVWPLARHDAQNTGRADVPGLFRTAPVEVWRYGGLHPGYGFVRPVDLPGGEAFLRQFGSGLEVVRADGRPVWVKPTAGVGSVIDVLYFGSADRQAVLGTGGNNGYTLLDLATGAVLWTWSPPRDAYQGGYTFARRATGGRLFAFPQNLIEGMAFDFATLGPPQRVWRQRYPNTYWANFGPYPVLADMDNDGREDILLAGKPSYFAVIDTETGRIKFDIHYPVPGHEGTGRPYGLLRAVDVDGDGFRDAVMVSCQVEEYIGIVRNKQGRAFEYAWSRFIEQDLPDDFVELRPNVTSLADVNGDGKRELVLGLFNIGGDSRWHTVVFDTLKGWDARLADLPGRYFWGCYDLDGDGRDEIVTSTEPTRRTAPVADLQAVDGRTFGDVAVVPRATLAASGDRLPLDTGFYAGRSTPLYAAVAGARPGIVLRRQGADEQDVVWRIADGKSVFDSFAVTPTARRVLLSSASTFVERPGLTITEPPRKAEVGAYGPLVCLASRRREIVICRTDLTVVGGVPDLARSGRLRSAWTARGSYPSVWMGPGGKRYVCATDWDKDVAYVYDPSPSTVPATPKVSIALPDPPVRSAGMLVPFGSDRMRLFVPLVTGVHTRAQAVFDEAGGRLWLDPKEGPHPRQAAAFRNSEGRTMLFVDNHGKHMLVDALTGKSQTVAHGWYTDIPGRGDGSKYVLPIVGPFGPSGATRLVLSPGLENLEILDEKGARLAKTPYGGIYERSYCGSAMARIRGDGRWDVGMVTNAGVFHSADADSARDRWKLPLGVDASPAVQVCSGDIDGDGRDNYLLGLGNGDLVALDERSGQGIVLWRKRFPAGVRGVIIADVDGDGRGEIIVETEDYSVRILKPAPSAPRGRLSPSGARPDARRARPR